MVPSVCIIGVYFGKFPDYFSLWLRSAACNPSIDYLIVTDQRLLMLPKNIKIVSMDLQEFKAKAQEKLGISIALNRPYKCCDIKPAYGMILCDYIGSYDYWGHCDFDMIFGDLRAFFTKYKLNEYDKFLDLGHLSLYRNTVENNKRFMLEGSKCGSYKDVFTSESNHAFDELSGVYAIFKNQGFRMFDQRIYADISKIHKRFTLAMSDNNYEQQIFAWMSGKVFRLRPDKNGSIMKDEYIYIHFKERGKLPYDNGCITDEGFYITRSGFHVIDHNQRIADSIAKYNPYPGFLIEKCEDLRYQFDIYVQRIRRKLGIAAIR